MKALKPEDMSTAPIEPGTIHIACGLEATTRNKLGWLYCIRCSMACHPAVDKLYYTSKKGGKGAYEQVCKSV